MLQSVDGKISFGPTDELDFDKDMSKIPEIYAGRHQYLELEQQTDLFSLNTGKVMAKIGVNERTDEPKKMIVSFIVIDNQPHLKATGVNYLSKKVKKLFIVTNNKEHPAYKMELENVEILYHEGNVDFALLFKQLKEDHGIERVTVQSGGTLNAVLIRAGLIDYLSVVVAPMLVGGENTPTLIEGEALKNSNQLHLVKTMELIDCHKLQKSYLHLLYRIILTSGRLKNGLL